jgi:membrane protein DedA with SNARE-associated domain
MGLLAANVLFRLRYDFIRFLGFFLVGVVIWLQILVWPGVSMCWVGSPVNDEKGKPGLRHECIVAAGIIFFLLMH